MVRLVGLVEAKTETDEGKSEECEECEDREGRAGAQEVRQAFARHNGGRSDLVVFGCLLSGGLGKGRGRRDGDGDGLTRLERPGASRKCPPGAPAFIVSATCVCGSLASTLQVPSSCPGEARCLVSQPPKHPETLLATTTLPSGGRNQRPKRDDRCKHATTLKPENELTPKQTLAVSQTLSASLNHPLLPSIRLLF